MTRPPELLELNRTWFLISGRIVDRDRRFDEELKAAIRGRQRRNEKSNRYEEGVLHRSPI